MGNFIQSNWLIKGRSLTSQADEPHKSHKEMTQIPVNQAGNKESIKLSAHAGATKEPFPKKDTKIKTPQTALPHRAKGA